MNYWEEPAGEWVHPKGGKMEIKWTRPVLFRPGDKLYTQPPPPRAALTAKEISKVLLEADWPESILSEFVQAKLVVLIREVERAHGIKPEGA